jgi:hypothetical protein
MNPAQQHVDEQPVGLVDRERVVVRGRDRVGLMGAHRVVGEHVGSQQVIEGAHEVTRRTEPAGGEHAADVALQRVDVDLVDGDPVTTARAQTAHRQPCPTGEALGAVGAEPERLAQPGGVGEVVQRDDGREAESERGVDHAAVVGEFGA